MKKEICYIVSAMSVPDLSQLERTGNLLIAADAGYDTLCKQGIDPDIVVGDFDSLGKVPDHPAVIRHPVEKDDTDTLLAARIGIERGYRKFVFLGALGGFLDHTFANLQTLLWLNEQGAEGLMIGRATFGDPWIFAEVKSALAGEEPFQRPCLSRRVDMAVRQFELALEDKGEKIACLEARKHFAWYLRGVAHSSYYKTQISAISTMVDIYRIAEGIRKDLK